MLKMRDKVILKMIVLLTFLSLFSWGLFADGQVSLILKIDGLEKLKSVKLLNRDVDQPIIGELKFEEFAGVFNDEKGVYEFKDIPSGMYDILIETRDGNIEGVNLKAYDELEQIREFEKELTQKDIDRINYIIDNMQTYENKRRSLYIMGGDGYAKVLVELLRDRSFYGSKSEVTWRIEIWEFEKQYGAWRRLPHFEVIKRFRMKWHRFEKMQWIFEVELGGILIETGQCRTIEYEIPAEFDPSKGKVISE